MFNNAALDVFIGLVFVFLLYSLLATIVQEIIAGYNYLTKCGTSRNREFRTTVINLLLNIKRINPTPNCNYKSPFIHKKNEQK